MSKNTEVKCYWKPLICKDKRHTVIDTKILLYTVQIQGQVTPKTRNRKFSCSFILETPHTFLQYRAWNLNK
jgi:hypothetical protein